MEATISALLEKGTTPWYGNLGLWNLLILAATALIIFWYTKETRKLRIEAQKTNKYSFRPIIVLKNIGSELSGRREITVQNIGKGPALNIESRISQIHPKGGYTNLRELLANENLNNLEAAGKQVIRRVTTIDLYREAKESGFQHGIPNKFAIIFTYEDVAAFKYQTITLIEVIDGTPTLKKTITAEYDSGNLISIV